MDESNVTDGKHLDDKKKVTVKLISIERDKTIAKEDVDELNTYLREGFRRLAEK
jgi:hypothetical protein